MQTTRSREFQKDHRHITVMKSSKDRKLSKLITSGSDTDGDSEHELSYYINDRVKLMKEVLKIIKPKKIKSMAPDCMKKMDLTEINSMLLEELLGISNKRLKYIFEGKTLEEESSTDEESMDVISLDDISDDDFVVISDEENSDLRKKSKRKKIKDEPREKTKRVKKEKPDREKSKDIEKIRDKISKAGGKHTSLDKEALGEENLMSVLELLELQARARAIRSQLELENKKKQEEQLKQTSKESEETDHGQDDDEIILEVPQEIEIVITSSDSENEADGAGSSRKSESILSSAKEKSDQSAICKDNENDEERGEMLNDNQQNKDVNDNKNKDESDGNTRTHDTLQAVKDKITESSSNSDNKTIEEVEGSSNLLNISTVDTVVEKFIEEHPPSPDKLKEEEAKRKDADLLAKISKEKRLKSMKSKLQSFKQDMAFESNSVTLKSKTDRGQEKHLEECDNLVINVDQDDLDCIISD